MDDNDGLPPEDSQGADESLPDSLLPYDQWTENALRMVVVSALNYASAHGLPGGHHFYVTFRTDHPRTVMPNRLRSQYPHEMTIVLQHQFWDLVVDEADASFSVGLSFNGVPCVLTVPLDAVTGFADPSVQFGLRFHQPVEALVEEAPTPEAEAAAPGENHSIAETGQMSDTPQVVSLDAFRRRSAPKD